MRIHIVTNANTLQYYRYCVQNHKNLASSGSKLEFIAYCMDDLSYSQLGSEGSNCVRVPNGSGSVGHATGITAILQNLKNDETNIVTDSDCVILAENWDLLIEDLLKDTGIVGTTFEDIGGFSSGDGPVQMYKRIPTLTWAALNPKYDWNFDPSCQKSSHMEITTQELSETFNLPIGFQLFRETYWQLPVHLKVNQIPYKCLKFVRPTSAEAKAVLSGQDYHTEFQLDDGTPFVAHQRGALSKQFRSHPLSKSFYDACEKYFDRKMSK